MKPKKTSMRAKTAAAPRARRTTTRLAAATDGERKTSVRTGVRRKKTAASTPAEAASAPRSKRRSPTSKAILEIPPILLEGDQPTASPASGPGQRYALGPTPPVEQYDAGRELPEAYGTKQLLLTARDPHWLYAHWDLSREQQLKYNSLSA